MPLLLDTENRTHALVRSINDVLIDHGPGGLTLRRIARASGVSTSSILHQMGSREHLLRVAALTTARERLASLRSSAALDGMVGFLPRDAEEVLDARAWLAWLELWRAEDSLERAIGDGRAAERALLAAVLDYQLAGQDLDAMIALIEGLRVAVCAPHRPMRCEVARELLATACHTLLGSRVNLIDTASRRSS